jgi:hypothetical protein
MRLPYLALFSFSFFLLVFLSFCLFSPLFFSFFSRVAGPGGGVAEAPADQWQGLATKDPSLLEKVPLIEPYRPLIEPLIEPEWGLHRAFIGP